MGKNIEFDILARDRASKTFDNVGRSSDGLGSKLGGLGKIGAMAVGGAAVGGIVALGAAMVNGVKDAASYQQLAAKTAAVLKSTGNAANQSVLDIQRRAGALETMSGVDEEIIINGQNVLATFTKVRDGVGKGNDIFNRATRAALDMSTALGTDLQGSTIQLGKALNDPVKGITALSRVGVSFTQGQKDQIKAMVKAGDTMGAQKLILGELNKEFGGSAKAAGQGFSGAWARAKDSVQDAFRSIGEKLLPILTKVADYVAEHGGPFIEKFTKKVGEIWDKVKPGLVAFGDWFMNTGIPAVKKFGSWIKDDLWPALKKGYDTIMPGIKQALAIVGGAFKSTGKDGKGFGDFIKGAGKIIVDYVIPILSSLIRTWLPMVATQWRIIIEVIKVVIKIAQTLGNIWAGVIKFLLRGFADVASMFASMLRTLAKVPGFGWAKSAADKLQGAANKARDLARAIDNIQRTVNVKVNVSAHAMTGRINVGGQRVNIGMFAKGGVNIPAGWKIVGEQGPELMYTPGGDTVIPADQTRQVMAGTRSVGSGSSGGSDQPLIVQFVLDGKVVQQSLLKVKRQGGVSLGLA